MDWVRDLDSLVCEWDFLEIFKLGLNRDGLGDLQDNLVWEILMGMLQMGKDSKTKTEKDSHKKSSKKTSKKSEETVKVDKKSHKKESKDSVVSKDSIPKKPSSDKQSKSSKKENTIQSKPKKPVKESNDDEEPLHEIQKKPGQKHSEPSLDDPTRAFYETLYEQNPSSQMAQKYCLEYGLLPEDVALSLISKLRNKK